MKVLDVFCVFGYRPKLYLLICKHNYSVPSSDIVFLRKINIIIYTKTGTYKSLLKTKILEKLPKCFIQIHASYILNPKYIKDFDSKTVTILLNGTEEHLLPISRSFSFF
ncbi:MAG: LytTR family DNA-binding domain-containing protein [Streptococcus sp.]